MAEGFEGAELDNQPHNWSLIEKNNQIFEVCLMIYQFIRPLVFSMPISEGAKSIIHT